MNTLEDDTKPGHGRQQLPQAAGLGDQFDEVVYPVSPRRRSQEGRA